MSQVLVLGCGLVSPPLVQYLTAHGHTVTVATRNIESERAKAIRARIEKNGHTDKLKFAVFDATTDDATARLNELVPSSDLVVSLLPYIYHCMAARVALAHEKHFCTSSYISDEMAQMDADVKSKGLVFLNECGVDPGLDHMSAMSVIDKVHEEGGKVVGFYSICGGLPAPDCNDNPLGYKLSWAPRGVLLASRNGATYLEHDRETTIQPGRLFDAENVRFDQVQDMALEWYMNRNSVPYQAHYGIPEARTVVRGTYRFQGWCQTLRKFGDLKLTSLDTLPFTQDMSYMDALALLWECENPVEYAKSQVETSVFETLEWLGLFDNERKVPAGVDKALDLVCTLMLEKMQYKEGERDMIAMKHTFEVERADNTRELIFSELVCKGEQHKGGDSAMARTVTLPLGVAIRLILEGKIEGHGVVRPTKKEFYQPILAEMSNEFGVTFVETKEEKTHLWLRAEIKPGEERTILPPAQLKKLIGDGADFRVTVEESAQCAFKKEEYAGFDIVPAGSWKKAPANAFILGLKELPEGEESDLLHRHVFFAHCFKHQPAWREVLMRFADLRDKKTPRGQLYDLEFLTDAQGRRVAAFGRMAGITGMAVGILAWCARQKGEVLGALSPWQNEEAMVAHLKRELESVGKKPTTIVIGALGRCGQGALHTAKLAGLDVTPWDIAETKERPEGQFEELLQHDIFLNAILLPPGVKLAPFLTMEMLEASSDKKLSVMCDVSCDAGNPNNPVPVYQTETTLFDPVRRVSGDLDVVAIDHLPSLLPREASEQFAEDLLPTLQQLRALDTQSNTEETPWTRAHGLFLRNFAEAAASEE
ncbi:MAG: hypothetical protein MHM6MM_001322 [Cercozoa sp. M6MM]